LLDEKFWTGNSAGHEWSGTPARQQPWRLVKHWAGPRFALLSIWRGDGTAITIEAASAAGSTHRGWQTLQYEVTPETRKSLTDVAMGQYRDGLTDFNLADKPVRAITICWSLGVTSSPCSRAALSRSALKIGGVPLACGSHEDELWFALFDTRCFFMLAFGGFAGELFGGVLTRHGAGLELMLAQPNPAPQKN